MSTALINNLNNNSLAARLRLQHQGKNLVMKYEYNRDARSLYFELHRFYTESTQASLDAQNVMTWLTTARLGNGKWRRTTYEFVLHFEEKVDQYNSLCRTNQSAINDHQTMTLLQNAVSPIRELSNVSQQLEILFMTSGVTADYMQYRNLLLSACSQYDRSRAQANTTVNVHNAEVTSEFTSDHDDQHSECDHNMDDDLSTSEDNADDDMHDVNMMQRFVNQLRLNKETWNTISSTDQAAWDKLSPEGKQTILNFVSKNLKKKPPSSKKPFLKKRSTNQVDINHSSVETSNQQDSPKDDFPPPSHDDATLIINNLMSEKHPASIPRLLSSDQKSPPSTKPSKSHDGSMKINTLQYIVRKQVRHSGGALIDRGANGGIAGTDTRIIERTPHYCDLSGIDNHEMTHVPIVTAGATVRTNRGYVILIMHNYAKVPDHKTIHSSHQLADNGIIVDDRHKMESGTHSITTPEGYIIPLSFRHGLPYMAMRPYTDSEFRQLPHVNAPIPEGHTLLGNGTKKAKGREHGTY